MAAALLGDEKAGHLALHPPCDHDRARSANACARRDFALAEYLARRIDHHRPRIDRYARAAGFPVLAFLRFNPASARWIASAARAARSASFSCATG